MKVKDLLKINKEVSLISLSYLTNKSKIYYLLNQNEEIEEKISNKILEIIEKEKNGIPLQYAIGKRNFYGIDFFVDNRALIPRYETEIMVEKIINSDWNKEKILDIGTGSGVIALTLSYFLKNSSILACDISEDALNLAKKNKDNLKIKNVKFIKSDIYENIKGKFNIIVSNPPYIDKEDMKKLDRKLAYEPQNALYGGEDGLYFYRNIIKNSIYYLAQRGIIILEIGYNQRKRVEELLKDSNFKNINCIKDYNNFDRIIYANL